MYASVTPATTSSGTTEATEVQFQIVAHIVSQSGGCVADCDCIPSVTARLVLRDADGYNRAVLAVGDTKPTFHESVESAVHRFEAALRRVQ